MTLVEIELGVIGLVVLLLGSGIIDQLKKIHEAMMQNFEDAMQRAMTHTEVVVQPEKAKKPCHCGHSVAVHYVLLTDGTAFEGRGPCHALKTTKDGTIACPCLEYLSKRGPGPGEVVI